MKNFFAGMRFLGSGMRRVARRPKLLVLGIIPAILSLALFVGLFVVLFYFLGDLSEKLTWFADDWSTAARSAIRLLAGIAIVGAAGFVAVVSFTAVTLLIGDPFYETIAESVEDELGGVPGEIQVGFFKSIRRSLADSLRLTLITIAIGVPMFFVGLIPVVGEFVVPVLAAAVGGWFLAVELVGIPFQRRGLRLRARRQMLRQHRSAAMGFGIAVFLCFLVPLGAVLVMPAAVAGGVLLTRHIFGQPTTLSSS
jgi:CysZ protein